MLAEDSENSQINIWLILACGISVAMLAGAPEMIGSEIGKYYINLRKRTVKNLMEDDLKNDLGKIYNLSDDDMDHIKKDIKAWVFDQILDQKGKKNISSITATLNAKAKINISEQDILDMIDPVTMREAIYRFFEENTLSNFYTETILERHSSMFTTFESSFKEYSSSIKFIDLHDDQKKRENIFHIISNWFKISEDDILELMIGNQESKESFDISRETFLRFMNNGRYYLYQLLEILNINFSTFSKKLEETHLIGDFYKYILENSGFDMKRVANFFKVQIFDIYVFLDEPMRKQLEQKNPNWWVREADYSDGYREISNEATNEGRKKELEALRFQYR